MKAWIAWCLALMPIGAPAAVTVERAESQVMDTPSPLQVGDQLLAYQRNHQRVTLQSAFDFRLIQAELQPLAPLQLEVMRGDQVIEITLAFGVAEVRVRDEAPQSEAAALDQAWVDAIEAKDWPTANQLRDQAVSQWQGVAGELARLRGTTAMFAERQFESCDSWAEAERPRVDHPAIRALLLEQQNHCIGYANAGGWKRGLVLLDEASAILERSAPESLLKARIDALRAQILSFSDPAKGKSLVEAATEASLAACGRCEAVGVIYQQAGDVYANLNDYASAERAYRLSVEFARALLAEPDSLATRLRPLSRTLRVMGRLDEAWDTAREALDAIRRSSMPADMQIPILNSLGAVAANRGDFREASRQFQAAVELGERSAPDSLELANPRANLGWTLMEAGDFAAAEVQLRQAVTVLSRFDSGINLAVVLAMLADLETRRGNDEQALALLDQTIAIHQRINAESVDFGQVQLQRALLLERMGRDPQQSWDRAMEIFERLPSDNILRADPMADRGYAELRAGRAAEALGWFSGAIELLRRDSPDSLVLARALQGSGQAQLSLGKLADAARDLDLALSIRARDVPRSATHAESLHAVAQVESARGDQDSARLHYCQASEMLDQASFKVGGDSLAQARFRSLYANIYRDCVEAEALAGDAESAFAALERFRARGYRAALEASRVYGWPTLEALMLNQDMEKQTSTRANDLSLSAEQRLSAQAEAAKLGLQRAELIANLIKELPAAAATDIATYQRLLGDGEALISFSTGSHRTVAFLLTRKHLRMALVEVGTAQLGAEVDTLRELLSPAITEAQWRTRSQRLYDQLFGPFAAQLEDIRSLRIAPDGPLHWLPFAALWNAQQQRYLLAAHELIMADGISAQSPQSAQARRRLLAVGISLSPEQAGAIPDGAPRLRSGLSALPAVRQEIQALAARPGTRQLLDREATEASVRRSVSTADELHFAVHAVLDPVRPMESALVLQPGSGRPQDDGLLTLREIIGELRVPHGLVVLSACETARGRALDGEGPLSFARAFSIAGATDTVASLWPINDQSTADLMTRFYRYRDQGQAPERALREAMLDQAKDRTPANDETAERGVGGLAPRGTPLSHRHPYYWASFQIWRSPNANSSGRPAAAK